MPVIPSRQAVNVSSHFCAVDQEHEMQWTWMGQNLGTFCLLVQA